ncbi:hypothetical protein F5B22DRAFT_652739 [Xylaria bambusicola]|uniref:uncharacterized protein n=1 Tax=Xylaria bambusicola TaxID=326684 RepID=UPI002007BCF7|nr:uncharacterized protein F5B22DRAFT_652739 [Xylaria bambusicola]KAI0502793.1 hypothetical protein F5B22DRAFT_652739 [Xylaria bambusicola]
MADAKRPNANRRKADDPAKKPRKMYQVLGFRKILSLCYFAFFAGIFMLFSLYRFQFLNFDGVFCSEVVKSKANHAAPGECHYMPQKPYKTAFLVHLGTILPAAILACLQFVPIIRREYPGFHKRNGYLVTILSFIGIAVTSVILPVSFGGGLDIQLAGWTVGLAFLWALSRAIDTIRSNRIDRHRVWMLRAWFWGGCIITQRIVQIVSVKVINTGPYLYAMPCQKINSMLHERTLDLYPECVIQTSALVSGTLHKPTSIVEAAAALDAVFGTSLFLAFIIHAIGVEIYLFMTSEENERLRKISEKRRARAAHDKQVAAQNANTAAALKAQVNWPSQEGKWCGYYEQEYAKKKL